MTVEDAHKLVDDSICALLDANELLGCMIKNRKSRDSMELADDEDWWRNDE